MKQKLADMALAAVASATLLSGCAVGALPDGNGQGFEWIAVGTNEHGCTMFTKKATSPRVVVDSAIWYLDANGCYVANADACAPTSNGDSK